MAQGTGCSQTFPAAGGGGLLPPSSLFHPSPPGAKVLPKVRVQEGLGHLPWARAAVPGMAGKAG